jgi:hypothetical protein
MDSSTSHFKKVPCRALLLLAVALASWAACALYSLRLNPEVNHYRYGYGIKRQWAGQMTREHGAKFVVYGGSSCEFSIDGETLLSKYGEPVVNDGRHAGMGPVVLTESALSDLRPGDTLIVGLEPGLLTMPFGKEPALGVQFSFAVGHPGWVLHPALGMGRATWIQAAAALRPGGFFTFTLLGKWIRGQPSYRYKASDFHRSGWCETDVRVPMTGAAGHGPHLSEDARALLTNISLWCRTNGIRVAYSLAWSYCPPDQLREFRKSNAEIVAEIMPIIPVLRDDSLGANLDARNFADTALHLSTTGAAQRTDEFGRQIQQWNTWTREDLDRTIAGLENPASGETKTP